MNKDDVEVVSSLDICDVEIVVDDTRPDKVELYMLDKMGQRIEGGEFDRQLFIDHVTEFYNRHY